MNLLVVLAWLGAAVAAGAMLTRIVLLTALRRRFVDRPNERSSHRRPKALGGGWGVMLAVLPLWAAAGATVGAAPPLPVIAAVLLLIAVSWLDDLHNLAPLPRLAAHLAAVALGLAALPGDAPVFQGLLPFWADRAVAGLAWVWFVNLYNFMDGIDGITGVETTAIALGLALCAVIAGAGTPLIVQSVILAGATLGFLIWNWPPARIFLGDVGSVPIGFLTGWLLLNAAVQGLWAAALILPGYYLADATLTLLRRAARGERVWQAHREHFYQMAVKAGMPHVWVSQRVLALNLVLVALAAATPFAGTTGTWLLVAAGVAAVLVLLRVLAVARPAAL